MRTANILIYHHQLHGNKDNQSKHSTMFVSKHLIFSTLKKKKKKTPTSPVTQQPSIA
jgi:hypothetical protein